MMFNDVESGLRVIEKLLGGRYCVLYTEGFWAGCSWRPGKKDDL